MTLEHAAEKIASVEEIIKKRHETSVRLNERADKIGEEMVNGLMYSVYPAVIGAAGFFLANPENRYIVSATSLAITGTMAALAFGRGIIKRYTLNREYRKEMSAFNRELERGIREQELIAEGDEVLMRAFPERNK